ncbi:calcium-translocating P-type ATPase, PMCA-type [Bacteroidia bacterium]|nr:calcium-translocating P-type ATPase, PMCA-type [Bacteroidia bacterium]
MEHNYTGLTQAQVQTSRAENGSNLLTPPPKQAWWKLFLEKFADPMVRILLVAAALSLFVSIIHNEYSETIGIFCAILLATGVGFWFEMDANKKFDLLNQINEDTPVKVIRDENFQEIPKKDIVVGDIVLLDTGDEIPADGVLLQAVSLRVDESSLTGEPSVSKTTQEAFFVAEATYPSNQLYRGTNIMEGHCALQITAVGDATEIGKVAQEASIASGEMTPLNRQLTQLARFISRVGFTVGILTFVALLAGFIIRNSATPGFAWFSIETLGVLLNYFMVAVTLIVVCVPEGLPMSVTLSLALNMRRMLKTHNLVRKMHACETMGAVTVICTDKTGTLTQNRMQVREAHFYGKESSDLVTEGLAVNSTAYLDFSDPNKPRSLGNPTEAALLFWLNKNQVSYIEWRENTKILQQMPFSTERKYMATLVQSSAFHKKILYVKGAPEIVFAQCKDVSLETQQTIGAQLLEYQNKAMRTLAFASLEIADTDEQSIEEMVKSGLQFLGFVAISDPVREDVPQAVASCQEAGIQIKIITGDTPGTAKEIGRQIGVWKEHFTDKQIISGVEFAGLSDEEALKRVKDIYIMCRARPTDKQRMVQLLQKCGEIVAVTGDGTNDAPALNFANVGLSMGSGTSVAKDAGDITLLDDSFRSIATAVMWGRSLYKNIQRFLLFQLTINFTALMIVLIGSIFGGELPLTVTQMLWINLIMDTFAACALASLPPDIHVMHDKPRKNEAFIINRKMTIDLVATGIAFVVILCGLLYYFTSSTGEISPYNLSLFFTVFVLLQFWNLFNAKAFDASKPALSNLKNAKMFLVTAGIILTGQFLIVTFGGEVFRTTPLTAKDWGICIAATSLVLWIKALFMRKR